jgi:hypothetical protein
MPDLPNRIEYEKRLSAAVAAVLAHQRQQAQSSLSAVPWSAFSQQLRSDPGITAALAAPFSVAATGLTNQFNVGVGKGTIDRRAEQWARDWQSVLAVGMVGTGKTVMGKLGDNPAKEETESALERLFGQSRAHVIGVTETTRAVSWGEVAAAGIVEAAISMRVEPEWESESDADVCEECSDLDGSGRAIWSADYPFGPPGPHAGCRCRLQWKIRGPIGAKG